MHSHSVLKRFVKDYSLPIQLLQEPYFDYFIDLYNKQFDTKNKYKLLCDTINICGNEQNFMEQYHKIKDNILETTMKNNSIFIEFNNAKLEEYNIPHNSYGKDNVFNEGNVDKYFLSIDLKKANFQAMKYYNKNLVLGFNTYDEFMYNFTDLEYMIKSKYIRQVIFGNLNPKKQIKIQQFLTYKLLEKLIDKQLINKDNVQMLSPDEIVCEFNIDNFTAEYSIELTDTIKNLMSLDVDIEIYKLGQIKPFKFYVKKFVNKQGYELTCVPLFYFSQVYKMYNNLKLNDYDLSFFFENQVAKFIKPLEELRKENE